MAEQAIEVFKKVAALNKADKCREGNVIKLPAEGRLIVTGDLHGNIWGFEQVVKYADLANNPDTHIIFQEIIHGGPQDCEGGCLSFKLLIKIASLKVEFPDNVHIIMGNHDLSAIKDTEVLRGGKEMTGSFNSGIRRCFGDRYEMVLLAMRQMLFSQPLAVKTHNGIFISHSLPADRFADVFEPEVLERDLKITDINRPNSAYLLLWGRDQSPQLLEDLSDMLDARLFVVGHQKQDDGFKKVEPNMLILACDHNNGCIAEIDLATEYDLDSLCNQVKKLYDLG
ncbi:MAG: metallophosphoesterase [Sedimentisphaeraceae bacterium JB056]